jgi:hypothetical protein
MNPTSDAFEKRFAALEGGSVALAVASGQAVSALSVQNRAKAGDNIVKSNSLYDGAWNLSAHTLRDQGVETRFVDPADPQAFVRASDERTRCRYADPFQSETATVPDRRSGGARTTSRHPADRGQHCRSAVGPRVRSWRRCNNLFRHQKSLTTWHDNRRLDRGRQQLRLRLEYA